MPANHTPNYQLSQWERADKVLMEDFNADNAKIDAAIKAVDVRVDGKADRSALEALTQTVSKKAEQSALNSLSSQVAQRGNCRIWTTTYTGSGQFGQDHPTTITFPKMPAIVFILSPNNYQLTLAPGQTYGYVQGGNTLPLTISWSGNTVSWYHHMYSSPQMNDTNTTYRVVAFMTA